MTTEIQIANGQAKYQIEGFSTINDQGNISSSFLNTLSWSFNKGGPYKEVLNNGIHFSGKNFYLYGDDVFMFEYNNLDELNTDSENWKKRFKKKNAITSENIDGKQILEPSGYFEYNGKFYLLGLLYQDLNESDNDESSGVYKGAIVNHEKYFEVENEKKEVVGKINDTL